MQFGPRIRIGGTLGQVGQNIKREGGKALRNPWVQGGLGMLTGGATLPLLAGAVGGFLSEKAGVGDVLRGGAQGLAVGGAGAGIRKLGASALNRIGGNIASDVAGEAGTSALTNAAEAPTAPWTSSMSRVVAPIAPGAGAPASVLGAPVSSAGNLATALQSVAGGGPGRVRSALNATGSFAARHDNAIGGGLKAIGSLGTMRSQNRMNEANAHQMELDAAETEYSFDQRKRRDAALAPLWSQLGSSFKSNYDQSAKNPYLPAGS